MNTPVFLRPETKVEPLAGRWYAWSHLVSPVQHALNVAYRYLPLLESFVANPSIHGAAMRNPGMMSGPFVPFGAERMRDIHELIVTTRASCAQLITFAEDLRKFEQRLHETATGHTLDSMYTQLPASLGGFVELVYDLNNHPHVRLLEEMVYGDGLGGDRVQELCLTMTKDEHRGFFLNTPRLNTPENLFLPIRFTDPRVDALAGARLTPRPLKDLAAELDVAPESVGRLEAFFSDVAPRRTAPAHLGEGVRLRYFGHASVLLQSASSSVLIDPTCAWEGREGDFHLSFADLPDHIDYVVITHNHQDHFSLETLIQLRRRIGTIFVPRNNAGNVMDPSMKLTLRASGFTNVEELEPFQTEEITDGRIVGLPFFGEHADLDIRSKQCVYVNLLGSSFLFMTDSDCPDPKYYERLRTRLGPIDTLFIGMECHGAPLSWLYGAYLPRPISRRDDESRRLSGCDSDDAWTVARSLGCRRVYVYAMGMESWMRHLVGLEYSPGAVQLVESDKFVSRCLEAGLPAERLRGCREVLL